MPPFHAHLVLFAALVLVSVWHARGCSGRIRRRRALGGWLLLAMVVLWPVGDLAATVSLSVATFQRLVIMLAVAPLILTSLSTAQLVKMTKPAPVDVVTRRLARPGWAVVVVTILGTVTLLTPAVDLGARSSVVRTMTLVVVLGAGLILWIPALGGLPGTPRLSPVARAAYVFVSSLAVTSLSLVWIFARHPLYAGLHHQESLLHMTPLFDQQLAGFVAKLGAYIPLWAVAFTIFSRADEAGVATEESPMHWADVERELLRIDRRRARCDRHRRMPYETGGTHE